MGTRIARLGFIGYVLSLVMALGLGFWNQHLIEQLVEASTRDVDMQLQILSAGYIALELLGIASLFCITRLPPSVRAKNLVRAALALAIVGFVLALAQRVAGELRGHSPATIARLLHVINYADVLIYAASEVLLAVVGMRVARAASREWLRRLTLAALVARAAIALIWLTPLAHGAWVFWAHRGVNVLLALACAALAAVVTRIADVELPKIGGSDGKLSSEWRAPAGGIALYLGAGGARLVCALLGWAVMASARGAQGASELRDVRGGVLFVAALSAAASLTMLFALWRIAQAPPETRASAPATIALVLGGFGLLLDGWSTSITAAMLGGSLSAAFFAMDALPWIAAGSTLLGVGMAASLLAAFANLAASLERPDLAARARNATWLLVAGGLLVGAGLGLMKHSTQLLLVILIVALPLTIAGVVQLLRVAFGLLRVIRARLA